MFQNNEAKYYIFLDEFQNVDKWERYDIRDNRILSVKYKYYLVYILMLLILLFIF